VGWWAKREQELPPDGQEVSQGIEAADVLDLASLVLCWVQKAGVDELLTPGGFLLSLNSVEQLQQRVSLLFGLGISDNFNDLDVLL